MWKSLSKALGKFAVWMINHPEVLEAVITAADKKRGALLERRN